MDVVKFLKWFVLSKIIRKFHQIAMTIFVGTILGQIPSPIGIVGVLLFFLVYFTTYFYNDLIDLEDDKKKGSVYREKALVLGYASEKEFLIILGNLTIISTFLITLWDPLLAFFSILAVLLNNLRTHVKDTFKRQVLLILVELFNFEAFWAAFFGGPIPTIFVPLFIAYSSIYAFGHGIYRMRKKGKLDSIMKSREMIKLGIVVVGALIASIPALFLSSYHFAFLVLGLLIYALPMLNVVMNVNMGEQKGMNKVDEAHHRMIFFVGVTLFTGAMLYIYYGSPLDVHIPLVKEYTAYFVEVSNYFDRLQEYILERMFGDVKGLRESYDNNSETAVQVSEDNIPARR